MTKVSVRDAMKKDAYISECGQFRYWLLRLWDESLPLLCVIGCNPSTADAENDDPTIRKVIGFAEALGFGGVLMLNVGAFRATDPKEWRESRDPFGPLNRVEHLIAFIKKFGATVVVAAWGKPCTDSRRGRERSETIKRTIPGMKCWGRNGDGSPRHPLMLPYSTALESFS